MFTWGRGDYGQLGRLTSVSQAAEQQSDGSAAESGSQTRQVCLPAEAEVLHGATQVRYLRF